MPQEPQSETPRTDDLKRPAGTFDINDLVVSAKFMEQQERELNEAKRDAAQWKKIEALARQEPSQVREELEIVTNDRNGVMAVNEKHRATISELAKQNHKMREALDKLSRLGNEPFMGNSDGNKIAQDALFPYLSSLTVLSRAEIELMECQCKPATVGKDRTSIHAPVEILPAIKCIKCLILERFTK